MKASWGDVKTQRGGGVINPLPTKSLDLGELSRQGGSHDR